MEISKRLVQKGYSITVITEKGGHPKNELINDIKIKRIFVGQDDWFKKFRIWKSLWWLRDVLHDADIIHCHDVFFWYLPFRFLYPSKKIYTTFHGYEGYPPSRKAILLRKISEKLSWGNICIGAFIKKWYGTKPTYVSYGAVDVTNSANHESRITNHESAVFVGRLDQQTGIFTYVKAVEMLRKKFPGFAFTVIGDGPYKKMIDKKVTVSGFKKNPEKYFQKYRFAFVSGYLSILEAIAAKRLVFAVYESPLKKDYLMMTPFAPFIIIESNPEKIVERIKEIIRHQQKEKEMTTAGYEWVKKQSWEEVVNLYGKLWGLQI